MGTALFFPSAFPHRKPSAPTAAAAASSLVLLLVDWRVLSHAAFSRARCSTEFLGCAGVKKL
jgi:hypothetical protein